MSLINQMLRDLDARRALAKDRPAIPDAVHPVQRQPARYGLVVALGVGVVALAGIGYWAASGTRSAAPPPAVVAVAPPPQVAVVPARPVMSPPAPASQPATALQPATASQPSMASQPTTASQPAPAAQPAPAPQPIAAPTPRAPSAAAPKATLAPSATSGTPAHAASGRLAPAAPAKAAAGSATKAAAATSTASADAAPEGSIEKRPRGGQANEAAENEYARAVAAIRRGADAEAAAALQATLRLDPAHGTARQALMSVMVSRKQFAEAQVLAAEGLKIDPSQTGWAMVLARLQMENGKLAEATETLASHARYAERNADYQAFGAVLLQKQQRYREAAERYRAALALRPTESRWWYGLGLALESDQKPQEARTAFLRARDAGNLPAELAAAVERRLH